MPAPDDATPQANIPSEHLRCTAFDGHRHLMSGPLHEVARAVRRAAEGGAAGPLLIFDDATGRVVDVDMRGAEEEMMARLSPATPLAEPRRRGRPKLGVVAREVTLLPRHWEWLNAQPGGASVALRRLVDDARRSGATEDRARAAREAAYRFMHAVAGDLPGFEEAARALFAGDRARFSACVGEWPQDVRDYAIALAFDEPSDAGVGGALDAPQS
jgi:hypothetical protein